MNVELPRLPRPEIDRVRTFDVFKKENSFHCVFSPTREAKTLEQILLRIMKHVHEYHIRICQYFEVIN